MPPDLTGRWTITVPEAGELLGIGRDAAYRAAEQGELPTLRLGRRLLVPVPRLLELLGATDSDGVPSPGTPVATTTATDFGGPNDETKYAARPIASARSRRPAGPIAGPDLPAG